MKNETKIYVLMIILLSVCLALIISLPMFFRDATVGSLIYCLVAAILGITIMTVIFLLFLSPEKRRRMMLYLPKEEEK